MADAAVIPEGEVHLWWASLEVHDGQLGGLRALLDPGELTRADRFRIPDARRRFIAARAALRTVLGDLTGQAPGAVRFTLGERGKPRLAGGGPHFNASDSGDWVVVAVATDELGVDLEVLRPLNRSAALAERICTERELAALARLPVAERDGMLLRLWTCKEAALKAIGAGLAGGVRNVEVDLAAPAGPQLLRVCGDSGKWALLEADPVPGSLCTVVVPSGQWQVVHRRLRSDHAPAGA